MSGPGWGLAAAEDVSCCAECGAVCDCRLSAVLNKGQHVSVSEGVCTGFLWRARPPGRAGWEGPGVLRGWGGRPPRSRVGCAEAGRPGRKRDTEHWLASRHCPGGDPVPTGSYMTASVSLGSAMRFSHSNMPQLLWPDFKNRPHRGVLLTLPGGFGGSPQTTGAVRVLCSAKGMTGTPGYWS